MMTDALARLDAAAARHNLLNHSFYRRWISGELKRSELAAYAAQYEHVVRGLPRWLEAAAVGSAHAAQLTIHAHEESGHVALWREFVEALSPAAERKLDAPNQATKEFLDECEVLAAAGHGVAVAWALEAQSPEVSRAKLDGLIRHYGIDTGNGAAYFSLHAERDLDHRAELAAMIAVEGDGVIASEAAERVLTLVWDILSSVESRAAAWAIHERGRCTCPGARNSAKKIPSGGAAGACPTPYVGVQPRAPRPAEP